MKSIQDKVKAELEKCANWESCAAESNKIRDAYIVQALAKIHELYKEWALELVGEDKLCSKDCNYMQPIETHPYTKGHWCLIFRVILKHLDKHPRLYRYHRCLYIINQAKAEIRGKIKSQLKELKIDKKWEHDWKPID